MHTLDIREEEKKVDRIRWSDDENYDLIRQGEFIKLVDPMDTGSSVDLLYGAEEIDNLIKALEKTKELGWV